MLPYHDFLDAVVLTDTTITCRRCVLRQESSPPLGRLAAPIGTRTACRLRGSPSLLFREPGQPVRDEVAKPVRGPSCSARPATSVDREDAEPPPAKNHGVDKNTRENSAYAEHRPSLREKLIKIAPRSSAMAVTQRSQWPESQCGHRCSPKSCCYIARLRATRAPARRPRGLRRRRRQRCASLKAAQRGHARAVNWQLRAPFVRSRCAIYCCGKHPKRVILTSHGVDLRNVGER